jgi:hypothetical protein
MRPLECLSDLFRARWAGEIGTSGETYSLPSLYLENLVLVGKRSLNEMGQVPACLMCESGMSMKCQRLDLF